jgi:hypothetical protein
VALHASTRLLGWFHQNLLQLPKAPRRELTSEILPLLEREHISPICTYLIVETYFEEEDIISCVCANTTPTDGRLLKQHINTFQNAQAHVRGGCGPSRLCGLLGSPRAITFGANFGLTWGCARTSVDAPSGLLVRHPTMALPKRLASAASAWIERVWRFGKTDGLRQLAWEETSRGARLPLWRHKATTGVMAVHENNRHDVDVEIFIRCTIRGNAAVTLRKCTHYIGVLVGEAAGDTYIEV